MAGSARLKGTARATEAELSPFVLGNDEAVAALAGLRALRRAPRPQGRNDRDHRRFAARARRSELEVREDARRASAKIWQVMAPPLRRRVHLLELALAGADRAANLRAVATGELRRN